MFCINCGNKIDEKSKFCPECGVSVSNIPNKGQTNVATGFTGKLDNFVDQTSKVIDSFSQSDQENNQIYNNYKNFNLQDPNAVKREFKGHEWEKLGGFLLFIAVMGYLGAILLAAAILLSFILQMSHNIYFVPITIIRYILLGIFGTVSCVFLVVFSNKINNKNVTFLKFYHIVSILAIALSVLMCLIMIIFLSVNGATSYSIGYWVGQIFSSIIFGGIGIVLYTLYFVKSERVITYMGTDLFLRLSPFTRNVKAAKPAWDKNSKRYINQTAIYNSYNNQQGSQQQNQYSANVSSVNQKQDDQQHPFEQVNNQQEAQAPRNISSDGSNQQNVTKKEKQKKYCINCGNQLREGSSFCDNCGLKC